jgi:hypothetical protein
MESEPGRMAAVDPDAERAAGWTGPARKRFAVGDDFDLQAMMEPDAPTINEWLYKRTAEAIADLDRQIAERLALVPSGWLLCVHGVEMVRLMEASFLDVGSDKVNITWRQDTHLVPRGETCTAPGSGDRALFCSPVDTGPTRWVAPS